MLAPLLGVWGHGPIGPLPLRPPLRGHDRVALGHDLGRRATHPGRDRSSLSCRLVDGMGQERLSRERWWWRFWSVFVCGRLIRRNENVFDLEHMFSPLSSYISRRNFSKDLECLRVLRLWRYGNLLGFTPRILPKHSECSEKFRLRTEQERRLNTYIFYLNYFYFHLVESIFHTKHGPRSLQKIPDNANKHVCIKISDIT